MTRKVYRVVPSGGQWQVKHEGMVLHKARRHEADIGVEAASDGLVDYDLLLFMKQLDQLLLGTNTSLYAPGHVVKEADNFGLFAERRQRHPHVLELITVNVHYCDPTPHTRLLERAVPAIGRVSHESRI